MLGTEQLVLAGRSLYGERWQTELARALGMPDGRRVRQWLSGDRPIPDGVFEAIVKLLSERKVLIEHALELLTADSASIR